MRTLSTYVQPTHLGPITALCLDDRHRAWLVTGTSLGHLVLWDLRFGLLLRTWHIGGGARVRSIVLHPVKGRGRCVIVAADYADGTMLEIWDVEAAELVERFVRRSTDDEVGEGATMNGVVGHRQSSAGAIEAMLAHPTAAATVASTAARCVIAGLDFAAGSRSTVATLHGPAELVEASSATAATSTSTPRAYIIAGSADRKLRYWDLERVEASVVFSGQDADADRVRYHSSTEVKPTEHIELLDEDRIPSRGPHRTTVIAQHQHQTLRSHRDAVTALALVDLPFRCVLTGGRDGAINVYT